MTSTHRRTIRITAGTLVADAYLLNTSTADAIWHALPFEAIAHRWGDELYFTIPLTHPLEKDAREVVDNGDLGYWPQGTAFCIFFGPTPLSKGEEIRPASPVNVFGKIIGNTDHFRQVPSRTLVKVEKGGV